MDGNDGDVNKIAYPKDAPSTAPEPSVRHRLFGKTTSVLGTIATRASMRIKQLVGREVNITPPREIVAGLKHIIPGSSHEKEARRYKKLNKIVAESNEVLTRVKQVIPARSDAEVVTERDNQLRKILAESHEVLASATTVFPFTLFRDDVIVDRNKVTLTKRSFFFTSEVISIRIEDILHVKASSGPFFGSVVLTVRALSAEDHHTINFFWREDAIRLKHIIHGYVIARHNNIDCKHLSKEELIATLTELGHDANS